MANEFICSDCGGDGTRCQCHKKRKGGMTFPNYEKAVLFNSLHGTNFSDDDSLEKYLKNEEDLQRMLNK